MSELGYEPSFVESGDAPKTWDFEAFGYKVMDDHFSHQRYTAATLLCANDRIAIGAIRAANRHGLFARGHESRGRLRIAGHDDHPLSEYMYPALTTVAQDITGIGRSAINLLTERAYGDRGKAPVDLMKGAALKLREST
jgi:DNA-binding LacI/PurR family transcriptional regulator